MSESGEHPEQVATADGTSPSDAADELVIHGLLETMRRKGDPDRARRLDQTLRAIADADAQSTQRRLRFPIAARFLLSAAALFTLVAAVALVFSFSERSALAEVRRVIEAHRLSTGDRRYEIRVLSWEDDKPRAEPHAIMDTRAPNLLLVRHRPPGSKDFVVVGRDAKGTWAIRDDGAVERERPRHRWPPWSVDGDNLLVDSIDRILEHLETGFKLEHTRSVMLDSDPASTFDLVAAKRIDRSGPMPNRVKVWIDPVTRLVRRVVFEWDPPWADAKPDQDGRRPHRSPKSIILDRVSDPVVPTDWFAPESHAGER